MQQYKISWSAVLGVLLLTGLSVALGIYLAVQGAANSTTAAQQKALWINKQCSNAKGADACAVKEFTEVAKNNDISVALDVLSAYQKIDSSPSGCHFIGHVIAYEAVAKDPEKWAKVLDQLPVEACSGGLLMGLLEARKNFEPKLKPSFIAATCQVLRTNGSDSREKTCVHTVGHLALVDALGNIDQALLICNELESRLLYECSSGAFMENLFRRNLADHGTGEQLAWNNQELDKQQRVCSEYEGLAAQACWRELSHMFVSLHEADMAKVYAACAGSGKEELTNVCYVHAAGVATLLQPKNTVDNEKMCRPLAGSTVAHRECVAMIQTSLTSNSVGHE